MTDNAIREEYKFLKSDTKIPKEIALAIEKAFEEKFGVCSLRPNDLMAASVFGGFVEGYQAAIATSLAASDALVKALEEAKGKVLCALVMASDQATNSRLGECQAGHKYIKNVLNPTFDKMEQTLSSLPIVQGDALKNIEIVNGMNISDIIKMQIWWNNGNPKSFSDFWNEAFYAGIKQSHASLPVQPEPQGVAIGEYTLGKINTGKVFIQHSSGEGGEFSEVDFANTIKTFFVENF